MFWAELALTEIPLREKIPPTGGRMPPTEQVHGGRGVTFRREFVRCVIAIALLSALTTSASAQTAKSRSNEAQQIEPDYADSTRRSPFYESEAESPLPSRSRRETRIEAETELFRDQPLESSQNSGLTAEQGKVTVPVRPKTPLPQTEFDDAESDANSRNRSSFGPTLFWVFGILIVGWVARQYFKVAGPLQGRSPSCLEILARQALGPQQQLALIRLRSKVILVGTTPSGMSTLATIDDPGEVTQLMAELRPAASSNGPTWRDLFRPRIDDAPPVESVSLATARRGATDTRVEPSGAGREVADV